MDFGHNRQTVWRDGTPQAVHVLGTIPLWYCSVLNRSRLQMNYGSSRDQYIDCCRHSELNARHPLNVSRHRFSHAHSFSESCAINLNFSLPLSGTILL